MPSGQTTSSFHTESGLTYVSSSSWLIEQYTTIRSLVSVFNASAVTKY